MGRVLLGFFVAAFWIPILAFLIGGGLIYGPVLFAATAAITVPATLLVAVPILAAWRRHITFWRCLVAGLAAGIASVLALMVIGEVKAVLKFAPALLVTGAVSSTIFWAIGVRNNEALSRPPRSDDSVMLRLNDRR